MQSPHTAATAARLAQQPTATPRLPPAGTPAKPLPTPVPAPKPAPLPAAEPPFKERHDDPAQAEELERQQDA
jgi:hypothetical protein